MRRIPRLLGLVALALAALLIVSDLALEPARPGYEPVVRESVLAASPAPRPRDCDGTVRRWLVIGWDGASWELLLPLLDRGDLPHLARLLENAAYGDLYGFRPSLSPALWTTVATGRSPADHGIRRFDKRRHRLLQRLDRVVHLGRARRELYSNADRRTAAIWNLLDERERPSIVVGYHNTYPAEAIEGAMVSNFLVHARMSEVMGANRPPPPAFARSLAHPPQDAGRWIDLERAVRRRFEDEVDRLVALREDQRRTFLDAAAHLGEEDERWPYFVRRAYVDDTFHFEAARALLGEISADLTMVHFQGLDLAQHSLLAFHRPEEFAGYGWDADARTRVEAARRQYAGTVARFAERLDDELGALVGAAGPETTVLLLSDHGFEPRDDPWTSGGHDDAPAGLWIAAGPGVRPGVRLGATHYDVFPTLAATLGLPLSDELPGRVLAEALCSAPRPARVASYETGARFVPRISPPPELTDERFEELRSLGYLQ